MKRKINISIFLLIIFVIFIIIISNYDRIQHLIEEVIYKSYEEPINKNTLIINNSYFGINSNGENEKETTEGINNVIEYASKNNIKEIKLQKGTYLVGNIKTDMIAARAIILESNISIDLNGSTIIFVANDRPVYAVLSIIQKENVSIKNGVLIGDKDKHIYDEDLSSTHEYGNGIDVRGSKNIHIENLEIKNMTGDGIFICDYHGDDSEMVMINNCNILKNRRQGISITSCDGVDIYDNEIHEVGGTWPQSGIDLEADNINHMVENVKIYNNKFYNFEGRYAIICSKMVNNVEILKNEINSKIYIADIKGKCKIYKNVIKNGDIIAEKNDDKDINLIIISENDMKNSNINLKDVNNVLIGKNKINGNILIESANVAIYENELINENQTEYGIKVVSNNDDMYFVYCYQNKINENYIDKIIIQQNNIQYYNTKEELDKYLKKFIKE